MNHPKQLGKFIHKKYEFETHLRKGLSLYSKKPIFQMFLYKFFLLISVRFQNKIIKIKL